MKKIGLVFYVLIIFTIGCSGPSKPGITKPQSGDFYIAAWYAAYDSERGYSSFSDNTRLFDEINPVWYNLNQEYFAGNEPPFHSGLRNQTSIMALARANGIKVLPTIQNFGTTNFDPTVIRAIIQDPATRARHVTEIVNLVLAENYDGIDIDYENLGIGDREYFSAFIAELGAALKQNGKLLSVAVYAKTSSNSSWDGPGAQDWPALAESVDSLKIMAYDYHWVTFHAGPISPLDWLRDILNYAGTIPEVKGKIILGLPLYGLNWGGGNPAKEVMHQDVISILNRYGSWNYSRNSINHSANSICGYYSKNVEAHFEYNNNGTTHTVYFQDREAIRQRLALIRQYPSLVRGVTFWRLGGEDPEIWDELGKFK